MSVPKTIEHNTFDSNLLICPADRIVPRRIAYNFEMYVNIHQMLEFTLGEASASTFHNGNRSIKLSRALYAQQKNQFDLDSTNFKMQPQDI